MRQNANSYPVIDLHCDMPHYLATVPDATPDNQSGIGCATAYLKQGNVKLQVMAISSVEDQPDTSISKAQVNWITKLLSGYDGFFTRLKSPRDVSPAMSADSVTIVSAIENASALCTSAEPLEKAFTMLEYIIELTGRPLYISLTHHGENRFGGGNYTDIGLKDDGRSLLEYISGRKIAVDLSHTSDALAHDIVNHIDAKKLTLPIIASHSNFRAVYEHKRNLPDELAATIIERDGLIGMNFLRAFMHPDDPDYLRRHIVYGLELGGRDTLALGADYFHTESHPDPTRRPFYFEQHEHAGKYQSVLDSLAPDLDDAAIKALAFGNAARFIEGLA